MRLTLQPVKKTHLDEENLNVLGFQLDNDGKIIGCSAKVVEALGYENAEELVGKDFVGDVVEGAGQEAASEALAKAREGETQEGEKMALVGKDGEAMLP